MLLDSFMNGAPRCACLCMLSTTHRRTTQPTQSLVRPTRTRTHVCTRAGFLYHLLREKWHRWARYMWLFHLLMDLMLVGSLTLIAS